MGFRILAALLMGGLILAAGLAILQALGRPGLTLPGEPPGRRLYYCPSCGAEFLEVRKGRGDTPFHCGQPMAEREETGT